MCKAKAVFSFLLALVLSVQSASTLTAANEQAPKKRVAFVIDDFGNNMPGTLEMLNMPVPLTVAVMPFLPSTKRDAEIAHRNHHEVFVHLPMEPVKGKRSWLGPGAITTDLRSEEVRHRVRQAIDDVPHAIGINNHMGSKATADERIMRAVLEVCKERGMIYLDSKTTEKSVAAKVADELGVPCLENEIFLDELYNVRHITKQMERVCHWIDNKQECIAIGHVGPPGKKTASVLRRYIPRIQKEARFVTISKLLMEETP
jgi:polysaccharide deacetylase 2 family uncharacterized protein YibQ